MYAGHFAAGLAIRSAQPKLPAAVLFGLVFLPDLSWLILSLAGVEVVEPATWFDGWSHSLASIGIQALIAGAICQRRVPGTGVAAAGAVLSHLALDLPMHPARLQWYPHTSGGIGDFLHGWAKHPAMLGKSTGWWVEAAVTIAGLALYLAGRDRIGLSRATAWAGVLLVASLHLAFG